jgi:hypothetical protein
MRFTIGNSRGESPEGNLGIGISALGILEVLRSRRSGHVKFRNSERI